MYVNIRREDAKKTARLISVMPSDRSRGNDKQKHRRVTLKVQEQFLTVR